MMSESNNSRRDFLKTTGAVAAATGVLSAAKPVHAAAEGTIQVALVGCGGRGTGAAANALSVPDENVKLVAMGDVFEHRQKASYESLVRKFPKTVDVSDDHKFLGFDAYKKAMDCLNPGDVVILTTPPAFRWLHFGYAIEKGLNVFMEKPVTVDGPGSRKMFDLAEKATEKNLKVAVGLMCRHCDARNELFDRIQNGEIGEVNMLRAYRMAGPTGYAAVPPKPEGISDLMYQIKNFHGFLWLSGGAVSDFLIHNIDEMCWMKDAWPVSAKASGGRHYRGDNIDQNFDSYAIEYTFEDGTKAFMNGRTIPGCHNEFASYAQGSKGIAVISQSGHAPSKARIYKGHAMNKENLAWDWGKPEPNPYQLEWNHYLDAIRNDLDYNEAPRGTMASLVTSMGRLAAHTGQEVTVDDMLNHEADFGEGIENLTLDGDSVLTPFDDGKYPVPQPGLNPDFEY